jgi:hypothetical protein
MADQESTSLLIRCFNRPGAVQFANLMYCDYFKQYVLYKWNDNDILQPGEYLEHPILGTDRQKVRERQVGTKMARIHMVSPCMGELFYVRCLLAHRPANSFSDLRTIDGKMYDTFHEAATHFGLFTHDDEGHYVMIDAVLSYCTPYALRFLFSRIILEGYPATRLWERFQLDLARDFILSTHSEERGVDLTLKAISDNVHDGGHSLKDFGLPEPLIRSPEVVTEHETYAHCSRLLIWSAQSQFRQMNAEQKQTFTSVILAATQYSLQGVISNHPFFVEGS